MPDEVITYNLKLLEESARAWRSNPGLRCVYRALYATMREACKGGRILEVGSGIGVSRDSFEEITTTDIVQTPYVDRAMSAYELEPMSADALWSDIIAMDVLHHLREPLRFFASAASVLEPGGRIILVEPAATLGGRVFYQLFHHEPIRPKDIGPPFHFDFNGANGEFANMGMGVALFLHHREAVEEYLRKHQLCIRSVVFRDCLAYPLTGGYSRPQLLPTTWIAAVLKFEAKLPQYWMRHFGLRMRIVLEKLDSGE